MLPIKEVCLALIEQGFRNIILLEAHGGNNAAMLVAARELTNETEAQVVCLHPKQSYSGFAGILKTKVREGSYGESETSRVLATFPTLVRHDRIKKMT